MIGYWYNNRPPSVENDVPCAKKGNKYDMKVRIFFVSLRRSGGLDLKQFVINKMVASTKTKMIGYNK